MLIRDGVGPSGHGSELLLDSSLALLHRLLDDALRLRGGGELLDVSAQLLHFVFESLLLASQGFSRGVLVQRLEAPLLLCLGERLQHSQGVGDIPAQLLDGRVRLGLPSIQDTYPIQHALHAVMGLVLAQALQLVLQPLVLSLPRLRNRALVHSFQASLLLGCGLRLQPPQPVRHIPTQVLHCRIHAALPPLNPSYPIPQALQGVVGFVLVVENRERLRVHLARNGAQRFSQVLDLAF
eukprot:scaffold330_cov246-Pinguiococcus_pyrenoidosus.AAC.3